MKRVSRNDQIDWENSVYKSASVIPWGTLFEVVGTYAYPDDGVKGVSVSITANLSGSLVASASAGPDTLNVNDALLKGSATVLARLTRGLVSAKLGV
jgi:hypothetical protein